MAKRLIGTATTDAQGVATVSYVGEGAGILNIQAETSDGELCSLPLEIYDCLFFDKGLDGAGNHTDWSSTSNLTVNRGSEYTTLTPSESFSTMYQLFTDSTLAFEFDVNITYDTDSNVISLRQGSTAKTSFSQGELGITSGEWYHIKLVRSATSITPYVNEVAKTGKSSTDTLNRFYFVLDNTKATDLKFKNFMIYPI